MKLVSLLFIAGLGILLYIVGANDDEEYLEIMSPVFMPALSQEEIMNVATTGEYDELLIKGAIYAGGLYQYHYRVFGDGTGILCEAVCTKYVKESMVENDYKDSTGWHFPDEYIEMIEILPEGYYSNNYISSLTKEDILSLLADLGDGSLPVRDAKSRNYDPGFGMGFGLDLYIDGKAVEYRGTKYEPNDDDVDVEILDWLENRLIPLLREKGEITDLDRLDMLHYIPDELVGKYSFIEIKRD